jgi:hypothetical protein
MFYSRGPKEKQLLVVSTFPSPRPTLTVYLMAGTEHGKHNR